MEIRIESLIEGSKRAKGLVVVIDVLRAFTTAAYIINNGAEKIIPVASIEEAQKLKSKNPEFLLIGERDGIKIEGFDYGNSPAEIVDKDFTGKIVIQTTSAGTQGVANATDATEIILGSFVCLQAIVNYIKWINPSVVTLVAMGDRGVEKTDEDELCAQAIKDLLLSNKADFEEMKSLLKNSKDAQKFFDMTKTEFNEKDFYLAMDLSRFNFILKVHKESNILYATKYEQ
jgi:2-phosphosulfolactate phosphatase